MDKKYIANPDFLLREIGGDAVLVPLGDTGIFTNSMLSLNETCVFLWKAFQTPKTVDEVIALAKAEYEAPEGIIEKEVKIFVSEYVKYELLKEE